MPETDRYVIEIIDVLLNVLESMAFGEDEFHSPANLSRKMHLNRSRLFRILKPLDGVDMRIKTKTAATTGWA